MTTIPTKPFPAAPAMTARCRVLPATTGTPRSRFDPPSTAGGRGSKMSRVSIVAMLLAAEVLIVGMAIYAVGGHGASFAAGMHRSEFTAAQIAPIAAGAYAARRRRRPRLARARRMRRAISSFTSAI